MSHPATATPHLHDHTDGSGHAPVSPDASRQPLQQQLATLDRELSLARLERHRLLDEIHELRQETTRAQRLSSMGEMTARLAHQIRTPLSTALLYASQLKQVHIHQPQHDCFVDRLLVGLRHLDHMVNDMLLFARGDRTEKQAVPVASLLEQVRQALQPQLQQAEAEWVVVLSESEPVLCGQQDVLVSVLGNLVTNALENAESPVRLEWQVAVSDGRVELALQDNGPGIPETLHEKIFEPFYTTRSQGTGLGLAVVRAVILGHNGSVELDRSFKGGARFVLRLPVFRMPVSEPAGSQGGTPGEPGREL